MQWNVVNVVDREIKVENHQSWTNQKIKLEIHLRDKTIIKIKFALKLLIQWMNLTTVGYQETDPTIAEQARPSFSHHKEQYILKS